MTDPTHQLEATLPPQSFLFKLLLGLSGLLLLIKIVLATRLDLYSDEIFYWLASSHLALAYSDLPFMASLLVWLGSALDPGNTLAVRSLFLVLGSSLPWLVYWLAKPVTGRSQALVSALFALCLPLGGLLGLLAVPDVAIIFLGLLSTGLFERCLRTDALQYWILLGCSVALGLCTHYRFVLYPAAAVGFLCVHAPSRRLWTHPKFWLTIAIASLGLIPILWFNLSNQMASASFYLVERHPWEFQPAGLLHVFIQAGIVTPPLYALLLLTLWYMLGKARAGDRTALMLLCLALLNLLVYMLLAPWADATSTTQHWPLSGYFPLLVYAPATLGWLWSRIRLKVSTRAATMLALAIPIIGFAGTLAGLAGVGSQAFQEPLQQLIGRGVLSNKMAGWKEFSAHTRELLQDRFAGTDPLLVTDNYYTAAQLAFAGVSDDPRTIDNAKAVSDGRRLQLQLWNMHADSLANEAGRSILFITEDSTLNVLQLTDVVAQMCELTRDMRVLDRLSLFNGDKQFTYYQATLTDADNTTQAVTDPCPYPPRAWLEPPVAGQVLSGTFHIEGWAYKEDIGIESVALLLDGKQVAVLDYGLSRPDVVRVMEVKTDPNAPNLGYALELDTSQFANGSHTLAIRLTDSLGVQDTYGERRIRIEN